MPTSSATHANASRFSRKLCSIREISAVRLAGRITRAPGGIAAATSRSTAPSRAGSTTRSIRSSSPTLPNSSCAVTMSTNTTLESIPTVPRGTIPATRSVTVAVAGERVHGLPGPPAHAVGEQRAHERAAPVHQRPQVDALLRDAPGRAARRLPRRAAAAADRRRARAGSRPRTDRRRVRRPSASPRSSGSRSDARDALHAHDRALVEPAPDAEHLQVDLVRDDVDARLERTDRGRVGEVDRQADRDAQARRRSG